MTAGSHASSAMTASSYASTAVPSKVEIRPELGTADFGNDFGVNMFDTLKETQSYNEPLPPPPVAGKFHRTVGLEAVGDAHGCADVAQESEPIFQPRASSRQGFTPSPNPGRGARDGAGSPYSFDGRTSYDGLMPNSALSSPRTDVSPGLPSIAPAFLGGSKQGYALVPERNTSPGLERLSQDSSNPYFEDEREEPAYANRQTQLDDGDRWNKRYELKDPQESASSSANSYTTPATSAPSSLRPQPSTVAGASRPGAISPGSSEGGSLFPNESRNATPRATKLQPRGTAATDDDALFDDSPSGPPSRAIRPAAHQRTESGTPKKMTKAQFEAMQKHASTSAEQSDEEADEEEDDDERVKQAQRQRRKQEANMAVYRQQMKKVTGGGPSDLPSPRPGLDRNSNSAPAAGMGGLHLGGLGGGAPPPDAVRGKQDSDDDEDVPLGILQAHGFPSGARPPTRTGEEQPGYQRAASIANGGAGQGNLPPFARRLPADPYFGAGLVNPANRESLAFSSSASMYGGAPPMTTPMGNPLPVPGGHPGGLVGVIASEESAKAARRTNPNSSGYGAMPLPSNMGMPPMPRTMSMGNLPPPQVYSPSGAPPMPMMPMMGQMPMMPQMGQGQDSNAQMQQFMQMQMQLMQNMLQMQQAQMGQGGPPPQQQQQQQPGTSFLAPPGGAGRPMSMASQAPFQGQPPNQGRSMTMLTPPSNWGAGLQQPQRPTSSFVHQGSYAPSVQGLQLPGGGPGAGYTPSIAPSERSNVGMPSRYRPVQNGDGSGRSQSMTSSMTLQAFQNQQPVQQPQPEQRSSTIRVIDKPKGAPKVSARAVEADEDEDEGWAEMAKKRNEKKFRWGRKEKQESQPALSELYQNFE